MDAAGRPMADKTRVAKFSRRVNIGAGAGFGVALGSGRARAAWGMSFGVAIPALLARQPSDMCRLSHWIPLSDVR